MKVRSQAKPKRYRRYDSTGLPGMLEALPRPQIRPIGGKWLALAVIALLLVGAIVITVAGYVKIGGKCCLKSQATSKGVCCPAGQTPRPETPVMCPRACSKMRSIARIFPTRSASELPVTSMSICSKTWLYRLLAVLG